VSIKLYSYWRSSAAYRVRIALNLKGLDHEIVPVSLAPGVAEHRGEAYRAKNPQMLVRTAIWGFRSRWRFSSTSKKPILK
jgi:hypothetical protein